MSAKPARIGAANQRIVSTLSATIRVNVGEDSSATELTAKVTYCNSS